MTTTATEGPRVGYEHNWRTRIGGSRLDGEEWAVPLECPCGARATRRPAPEGSRITDLQEPGGGRMVQDDLLGTNLPNGSLLWFGYDFERARLPDTPLLPHGDYPVWTGVPPGFEWRTRLVDAQVLTEAEELAPERGGDEDSDHVPGVYRITVSAHGMADEVTTAATWHEAQVRMAGLENRLVDSHEERHSICMDDDGNSTAESCDYCHL